ncbi:MAG: DUF4397 domain-containing protein [Sedimentibacter sp.]
MNDFMTNFNNYSNMYNPNYTNTQWDNYLDNKNAVYAQMNSCFCKKSFFRVLNTYSDNLDVQVNEIVMAENLNSGEFTRYVKFVPGTYQIKIYKSEPKRLIFESMIDIEQNLAYTGVIAEDDEDKTDVSVLMIPEARENAHKGKMAAVRLINLAVDAPDLELVASDKTILFSGINYGDVSNNVAVPSGLYTLTLQEKKSKNEVQTITLDFAPRMHYTLFVSGKYNEIPDVKIIIPEDGVNYLELC